MNQTEFNITNNRLFSHCRCNRTKQNLSVKDDLNAEKILSEHIQNPIGKLLGKIAELPQVRQQKVLNVRRQLSQGDYKLNDRLDTALDKILEELIIGL